MHLKKEKKKKKCLYYIPFQKFQEEKKQKFLYEQIIFFRNHSSLVFQCLTINLRTGNGC